MMAYETYDQIGQYINSLQGAPVDLSLWGQQNPNLTGGYDPGLPSLRNINWLADPALAKYYNYDYQNNSEYIDPGVIQYMKDNGYQWMQARDDPAETGANWIVGPDGKPIVESTRLTGSNYDNGMLAAYLAAAVTGANVLGAAGGAGAAADATGNGAWLGEGVASGVPAWDAAYTGAGGVLPGGLLEGNGAWLGEGVESGVPAWDAAYTNAGGTFGGLTGVDAAMADVAKAAPVTPGAGGGLMDTIGNAATTVGDKLLNNPQLIGAIGGAVLPLLDPATDDGTNPYTGPMPTITRGGWSPTATPNYMQVPVFGEDFMAQQTGNQNSGLWRYAQGGMQQPNFQQPQPPQMQIPQKPAGMQATGLLGQQQPAQQGLLSPQQMAPLVQNQYDQSQAGFSGDGFVGTGGAPIANNYTWGGDPAARRLVDTVTQGTGQQSPYNNDPNYWMARDDATGDWLWVTAGEMSPYNTAGMDMTKVDQGGRMVPRR